ncbi:MAG: hypothetical protein ACKO9Z_07535 [Planctomycetota bacterium]
MRGVMAWVLALAVGGFAWGQPAVDVIVLKSGEEIRGVRWGPAGPRAVWYVCRASWLRSDQPALGERLAKEQSEREKQGRAQIVGRLKAWKASLAGANDLAPIADELIERYSAEPGPCSFVATVVEAGQVARVVPARAGLAKLALVAWRENLEGVERRPAAEIAAALKEGGIAWEKETPDLLERLPGLPILSEADWKVRLAFLDYQSSSRLHLQGTGNIVVETPARGAALAAGQVEALMARVGKSTLEKAIGDLLGEAAPQARRPEGPVPSEAVAIARARKAPVFRLSRVDPDLAGGRVQVTDLLVSLRGAVPEVIWQARFEGQGANADPAVVLNLRKDPQVAKIVAAADALGAGGALEQALRAGAVTLDCWGKAEGRFQEVARVATRRLDGVPLSWLESR